MDNHLQLLCFDFGLKRIGVATGHTATAMSTPLTTLSAQDGQPIWAQIDAIVAEWQPQLLLIGIPTHPVQGDTAITLRARRFGQALKARYPDCLLNEVDEHLSSHAAEHIITTQRQNKQRKQRYNKGDIDSIAASVIIETWFSQHRIKKVFS